MALGRWLTTEDKGIISSEHVVSIKAVEQTDGTWKLQAVMANDDYEFLFGTYLDRDMAVRQIDTLLYQGV